MKIKESIKRTRTLIQMGSKQKYLFSLNPIGRAFVVYVHYYLNMKFVCFTIKNTSNLISVGWCPRKVMFHRRFSNLGGGVNTVIVISN